ncbi:MAG TPA: hypothetical protein VKE74_28480 [Gemmataceae bacterium]|nr:hypothetical protein [Gemmataceae bacterium]
MASVTTSEKAVAIDLARAWWLLWTSVGCVVAAVGVYRAFPGAHFTDKAKAVLAALCAAGSLWTCIWWLLSRRRLLIAESRVMLVSWRTGRLVGHIPFDDIETVNFYHGDEDDFFYRPGVTIRVRAIRGPETYWPGLWTGDTEVILLDRFVKEPEVLRKMLRRRWQDHQFKREHEAVPPGGFAADADITG